MFSGSHKGGFKDTGGAATSPSILPVTTDKFQRSHLRNVAKNPLPLVDSRLVGACGACGACRCPRLSIQSFRLGRCKIMPETDGTWLFPTRFEKKHESNHNQIISK